MTKQEQNAIAKVSAILQFGWLGINSALNVLRMFAPSQVRLITVLQYVANVIKAVLQLQPLPLIPEFLNVSEDDTLQSFALDTDGDGFHTENVEERAVTTMITENADEALPYPEMSAFPEVEPEYRQSETYPNVYLRVKPDQRSFDLLTSDCPRNP